MEDRTPRPYASSDEDFEMVPDANGTSDATPQPTDTLTLESWNGKWELSKRREDWTSSALRWLSGSAAQPCYRTP